MPLMLDDMRAEFARYLTEDPAARFRMDAALAHVITIAYERGLDDGKASERDRADYAWRNTNTIEKARQEEMAKRDALQAETVALKATITSLLEILRQWEPDHASGEDRQKIMRAMYRIGVLRDPAETVAAMKVGAGDTPMARLFGCCADDEDKTANVELTGVARHESE